MKGYEDGSFKPDQKMTRAEFVTIVNRIIKVTPVAIAPIFSDLTSHWAYQDIMAVYIK
ncbi:MAG: S-layer homology domain-containing protein [Oscillospiraceae bacterium]